MPKRTILAVDDEPLVARLVTVNLERAGYVVHTAVHGMEALDKLRSSAPLPDLLLLDVTMPYMDGFALLDAMRADPRLKEIRVVMMTARSRDADILHGHEQGVLHYLTKPLNPVELLQVVTDVIGPPDEAGA